jgi:hypothetical protein
MFALCHFSRFVILKLLVHLIESNGVQVEVNYCVYVILLF